MKRILVATDFSTRSDRALRRATLIARQVGASLTLVHVVDIDRPEQLIIADQAAAEALLGETAATIRSSDGIDADPAVVIGDVHSGILTAAEQSAAELIVIGPHRVRLRDAFVGTTVERVVRRTPTPLLVAVQPPSASHERTLLALDFDEASRSAGLAALAMGVFDHTDVIVMHAFDTAAEGLMRRSVGASDMLEDYVDEERGQAEDRLGALVTELGLPPTGRHVAAVAGTPARTILEAARAERSHLIVMGTNQRKGFERLLIGSVTEEVIRDAERDILIVPA